MDHTSTTHQAEATTSAPQHTGPFILGVSTLDHPPAGAGPGDGNPCPACAPEATDDGKAVS